MTMREVGVGVEPAACVEVEDWDSDNECGDEEVKVSEEEVKVSEEDDVVSEEDEVYEALDEGKGVEAESVGEDVDAGGILEGGKCGLRYLAGYVTLDLTLSLLNVR